VNSPDQKTNNIDYDRAFVPPFKAGLGRLNSSEQQYFKHLITPEAAFLMAKAFGPDMGVMLWPFIAEDTPQGLGDDRKNSPAED
jgi:hypothetical protein